MIFNGFYRQNHDFLLILATKSWFSIDSIDTIVIFYRFYRQNHDFYGQDVCFDVFPWYCAVFSLILSAGSGVTPVTASATVCMDRLDLGRLRSQVYSDTENDIVFEFMSPLISLLFLAFKCLPCANYFHHYHPIVLWNRPSLCPWPSCWDRRSL